MAGDSNKINLSVTFASPALMTCSVMSQKREPVGLGHKPKGCVQAAGRVLCAAGMASLRSRKMLKRAVARIAAGESVRKVARALSVAPSSVVKWTQRLRATGIGAGERAKPSLQSRSQPDRAGVRQAEAFPAKSRRAHPPPATGRRIGTLLDAFSPAECANYFVNSGYASV